MRCQDARPNGVRKYVLVALGRPTWLCLASCQTILRKLANELLLTGKRSCVSLQMSFRLLRNRGAPLSPVLLG